MEPKEVINRFRGAGGRSRHKSIRLTPSNPIESLGVMLGVYTGGISGAHPNPAVTLANCVFRKFPWKKFPLYMLAQTLGAMVASAIVYANYNSAIDVYEDGPHIRTGPGYSAT